MPVTGLNEATDAVVAVLQIGRREARATAREALKAARPEWEKPLRGIHARTEIAGKKVCAECMHDWPCPTLRAIGVFHEEPKKAEPKLPDADPSSYGYAAMAAAWARAGGFCPEMLVGDDEP